MRLRDNEYNFLKWFCLLFLPAVSVLYNTLAGVWSLPFAHQITVTLDAVSVFLGAIIGISTYKYNQEAQNGR